MMARIQIKQAAYLASLFMLGAGSIQANEPAAEPSSAWYYHETLTTPADSRAILKPYQHPEFRQRSLGNQAAFKQWPWLKQYKLQQDKAQARQAYLVPQSRQGTALPFWPSLKPK